MDVLVGRLWGASCAVPHRSSTPRAELGVAMLGVRRRSALGKLVILLVIGWLTTIFLLLSDTRPPWGPFTFSPGPPSSSRAVPTFYAQVRDSPLELYGENGKPVVLPTNITNEVKKLVDEGWQKNAFNQYVSDLISVHRNLPDPRDKWCKEPGRFLTNLPATLRHRLLPQRGLVSPPQDGPLSPRPLASSSHSRDHTSRRFLRHASLEKAAGRVHGDVPQGEDRAGVQEGRTDQGEAAGCSTRHRPSTHLPRQSLRVRHRLAGAAP
ncbi:hypothetical protein GE061_015420 [Apolygus lucorum]|uniref:Uncharacterized protein n=1 Tax=Apolygus lucorum TaxID=248454 RepID=A0A8S9XN05_APOLU|nr:hypothetical protein GE061_015420 [Apolygus lucorum]